jgi:NADPH:quinone reductase
VARRLQHGVELARRLGADEVIEGRTPDLVEKVRAFAPKGADAALLLANARADELFGLVKKGRSSGSPASSR